MHQTLRRLGRQSSTTIPEPTWSSSRRRVAAQSSRPGRLAGVRRSPTTGTTTTSRVLPRTSCSGFSPKRLSRTNSCRASSKRLPGSNSRLGGGAPSQHLEYRREAEALPRGSEPAATERHGRLIPCQCEPQRTLRGASQLSNVSLARSRYRVVRHGLALSSLREARPPANEESLRRAGD